MGVRREGVKFVDMSLRSAGYQGSRDMINKEHDAMTHTHTHFFVALLARFMLVPVSQVFPHLNHRVFTSVNVIIDCIFLLL